MGSWQPASLTVVVVQTWALQRHHAAQTHAQRYACSAVQNMTGKMLVGKLQGSLQSFTTLGLGPVARWQAQVSLHPPWGTCSEAARRPLR